MRNKIIDLFCGCGGLSRGFEMAGFDVKIAIDMWSDAVKTYNHNHKNILLFFHLLFHQLLCLGRLLQIYILFHLLYISYSSHLKYNKIRMLSQSFLYVPK